MLVLPLLFAAFIFLAAFNVACRVAAAAARQADTACLLSTSSASARRLLSSAAFSRAFWIRRVGADTTRSRLPRLYKGDWERFVLPVARSWLSLRNSFVPALRGRFAFHRLRRVRFFLGRLNRLRVRRAICIYMYIYICVCLAVLTAHPITQRHMQEEFLPEPPAAWRSVKVSQSRR